MSSAPTTPELPAKTAPGRSRPGSRFTRLGLPALVAVTVLVATVIAGPWTNPLALPPSVIPAGVDGTGVATAAVGARVWPSWVSLGVAPGGSGNSPALPLVSAAARPALPALVTGYRGWAAEPPAAVLAPAPVPGGTGSIADQARGIYLTGGTAGNPASFRYLVELVDSTGLNAMVINIKPESGKATYATAVQSFRDAGAVSVQIRDLEGVLRMAKAYGIYTIARLVVFNDSTLTRHNPDLAVKWPDGSLWRDAGGNYWADPFRPEVWEYNIDLAVEAAQLGFDEIQFDYVRFPTDGDVESAVYSRPSGPKNINRVLAITDFLNYARERLAPYGARTSADVYGIICSSRADTALGQVLEDVYGAVDYVSPMIYPSHYGSGHFGLDDPDAEPYLTIRGALEDALERLGPEAAPRLRPWLQDFTLNNYYGPEQVLDQIRATHELGIHGWLLWSPSNRYTEAALRAFTANQDAYLDGTGP